MKKVKFTIRTLGEDGPELDFTLVMNETWAESICPASDSFDEPSYYRFCDDLPDFLLRLCKLEVRRDWFFARAPEICE